MGQWGSRLSAGSRLLEVLEAGHCRETPDANAGWCFDSASLLCSDALLDVGGLEGRTRGTVSTKQVCAIEKRKSVYYICSVRPMPWPSCFVSSLGCLLFVVAVLGCYGRLRLLPRSLMRALLVASCVRPKKPFILSCYFAPSILRSSLHELLIHLDSFPLLH